MGWRALQLGVFIAFGFSNIYFEWGIDNGYAVSAFGLFFAICATYLVSWTIDLVRWWRQRRLAPAIRQDGRNRR
jgi:hypothetical protein